jgi:hypothetical protein
VLYFVIFLLELSWQCGIMLFFYWNCPDSVVFCYFSIWTVLTVWYFVALRTVPTSIKNNKIQPCQDSSNRKITKYHTVRTVPTSMKNFVIFLLELSWLWYFVVFHGCWNCSDSVVFCYFSIRTVLTGLYFVVFHGCWNCSESVVFCCYNTIPHC